MVNEVKNIYQPIIQEQISSTFNFLTLKHKKRSKKTKLKLHNENTRSFSALNSN